MPHIHAGCENDTFLTMLKLASRSLLLLAFLLTVVAEARGYGASTPSEVQTLQLINAARARGAACRGGGGGRSLGPLAYAPTLRVVALGHARDMVRTSQVSHYLYGVGPRTRVARAGYQYLRMSEIIYMFRTRGRPTDAVRWWLRSPVHCRAIMNPHYTTFGAGYGGSGSWTVVMAQPR